jgi:hypothetical protein
MTTVEVYKTNIHKVKEARQIAKSLTAILPKCKINFDLDDCDRILRIETLKGPINSKQVITLLNKSGFNCEVLAD